LREILEARGKKVKTIGTVRLDLLQWIWIVNNVLSLFH
jgi:hypothetical protein